MEKVLREALILKYEGERKRRIKQNEFKVYTLNKVEFVRVHRNKQWKNSGKEVPKVNTFPYGF